MALPGSKVQFFYNYKGRGISENLWNSGAPGVVIAGAAQAYLEKRLAMADDDMQCVWVRASDPAVPRKVAFANLFGKGFNGKLGGNGSAPDDAINLRFVGPNQETGRIFIHCFPAKMVKENVVTDLGDFGTALDAFQNYIKSEAGGWQIFSRRSTGNLAARVKIATATPLLPRGFQITTADAQDIARGSLIQVQQCGSAQFGYNGRKVIVDKTADNKTFVIGGASPVGTVPAGTGYFYVSPTNAVSIKDSVPVKLTERKTGRVFGEPAGRRGNILSLRR